MDYLFDHVLLKPDKQIGPHSQANLELTLIITGRGTRTFGCISENFSQGETVLVPPGLTHLWDFDPDHTDENGCIENISLHFSKSFLEKVILAFPSLSERLSGLISLTEAVKYDTQTSENISTLLHEMELRDEPSRVPLVISLLLLCSEIGNAQSVGGLSPLSSTEKRKEQIRTYISCNYRSALSIRDLASYAGLNRSAFCAFFKQEFGTTFLAYLNALRIERACELLRRGELSVSEVAYESGFGSLTHFSRTFRKLKTCSPSKWAEQFSPGSSL